MNKEVFSTLMYALTKECARSSFMEFLEEWEIPYEEYEEIKHYLKDKYDVDTYC